MKKSLFLFLTLVCQVAFSQTEETLLDGNTLRIGDSLSAVKTLFPEPWYEWFTTDSDKVRLTVALFKNGNDSKLLGNLFFDYESYEVPNILQNSYEPRKGFRLVDVHRYWEDGKGEPSYANFEKFYDAMKSNFDSDHSVSVDFKENSDPTAEEKEMEFWSAGSEVHLILSKHGSNLSTIVRDGGGKSFGFNDFGYERKYCVVFVDFKHILGKREVIAELFTNIDDAEKRLRELQAPYIEQYLFDPSNVGWITTVLVPKKLGK